MGTVYLWEPELFSNARLFVQFSSIASLLHHMYTTFSVYRRLGKLLKDWYGLKKLNVQPVKILVWFEKIECSTSKNSLYSNDLV